MNSSYSPAEPAAALWAERSALAGSELMCVAYGAVVILFFQCTDALLTRRPSRSNRQWITFGFLCATFVFASGAVGFQLRWSEMTFIDDRAYPGGPLAFDTRFFNTWIPMAGNSCPIIVNWLTDALLLYRCFVIWKTNYLVLLFPTLMYLGAIVCSIFFLVSIGPLGGGFWASKSVSFGTAYWSLSISLNIIITLLICYHLLSSRKRFRNLMQGRDDGMYTGLSAMLIESAALYSVWGIIFIVAYARKISGLHNIVISSLCEIQTISTFLIVLRVAQGRAWSRDTAPAAEESKLGTLQFGAPGGPSASIWDSESSPHSADEMEPKTRGIIPDDNLSLDGNALEVHTRSSTSESESEGVSGAEQNRWSVPRVL